MSDTDFSGIGPDDDGRAPAVERPLVRAILVGAWAGFIAGALEYAAGAKTIAWHDTRHALLAFAIASFLTGLVGVAIGAGLSVVTRFSLWKAPYIARLGAVTLGALAASWWYAHPPVIALLAALSLGVAAWTWKRRSPAALGAFGLWTLVMFAFSPFFSGAAITLVFTKLQVFMILTLALALVYTMVSLVMSEASRESGAPAAAGFVIAAAAGLALALTALSSIFLIKLWGFNTMVYLQVIVIVLQISLWTAPVSALFRLVERGRPRAQMMFTAVTAVVFVAAFTFSAHTGMREREVKSAISYHMPTTSLVMGALTAAVDMDGDTYSPLFSYGDCDDAAPAIHPDAVDWPRDGVDENCFGGDLTTARHKYFALPNSVTPPEKTPGKRKIVFLIVIDTLRADAVDYSGGPGSRTPALARIGKESLRFDNAYAQSNNTLESFPFLFQLGFRRMPIYNSNWTLGKHLEEAGIESAGVFQDSLEEWWGDLKLGKEFFRFTRAFRPDPSVRNFSYDEMVDRTLEALFAETDRDLFVFTHFNTLHDTFVQNDGIRMVAKGLNVSDIAMLWDIEAVAEKMREGYFNVLANIDNAVGRIWEKAKALEEEADVTLIVTSDHGEEFYEHGGLFHFGSLYDETVKVPLMIRAPGVKPGVISQPVGLYRIPPTILKFFGFGGKRIESLDLLRNPIQPFEVFSQFSLFGFFWNFESRVYMIVKDGYKMIYNPKEARLEMYRLASDPGERINMVGDKRYAVAEERMKKAMDTTLFYLNYGDLLAAKLKREKQKNQNKAPAGKRGR